MCACVRVRVRLRACVCVWLGRQNSGRYRLQSERWEAMWLVARELVHRLTLHYGGKVGSTPPPPPSPSPPFSHVYNPPLPPFPAPTSHPPTSTTPVLNLPPPSPLPASVSPSLGRHPPHPSTDESLGRLTAHGESTAGQAM